MAKCAEIPRLQDYHISETTGFVIKDSLVKLPAYFEAWYRIAKDCGKLLVGHQLRTTIDEMPLLDHTKLEGYRQWRLAYACLTFMGSGYVWQEGVTGVVKRLPKQLAIPWYAVSEHLGLHPCYSHAAVILSNWELIDPTGPVSIENLRSLFLFRGDVQCEWFFLVILQTELDLPSALKAMMEGFEGVQKKDLNAVSRSLDVMTTTLERMKSTISRLHEKLEGEVFFHDILPFLAGWGGSGSAVPDGILFEGVSETPVQVTGGSAAQTAIFQCFDAVLGIIYDAEKQKFFDNMKSYMPPAHAEFVRALSRAPSIKDFVKAENKKDLTDAYERCVSALANYRTYHIQAVTKYIVIPAKRSSEETNKESVIIKGTAGKELIPFLQEIRNSTKSATGLQTAATHD